jgi:ribose transport system ATP-binding protein
MSKAFPGVQALDDVDLHVDAGEVVAIVGQNGSGKSTLVKILAGVYAADAGTVELDRELHVIHQDLGLIGILNTIENLDLGRAHGRRALSPTSPRAEERHARELLARFGARFDVRLPVAQLTATERALVAIARALDGWSAPDNVLVLDEPTAALHGDEVGRLFAAVRSVAAAGAGVVFISHRLDEVMELADRVIAFRDGRIVADVRAGAFDQEALIQMIAGREISQARVTRAASAGADVVLSARDLAGGTVDGVDLDMRAGEIVGVSGILGSGREHVAGLLFGTLGRTAGAVRVRGRALRGGAPGQAVRQGVAYVPADRRAEGAVMDLTVRENLTLPRLRDLRRALWRVDGRREREQARQWVRRVDLRPPLLERPLKLYSGGNQQKVVLAKWLRNEPNVLLLDEPTQGVDVGAKAAIYDLIAASADSGAGVLVSSSDTKELIMLCDRVVVLRDGRVAAELSGPHLTEAQLVREGLGLRGVDAQALFGAGVQTDV